MIVKNEVGWMGVGLVVGMVEMVEWKVMVGVVGGREVGGERRGRVWRGGDGGGDDVGEVLGW